MCVHLQRKLFFIIFIKIIFFSFFALSDDQKNIPRPPRVMGTVQSIVSSQKIILAANERLIEGEKLALISKDLDGVVYGYLRVDEPIGKLSSGLGGLNLRYEATLATLLIEQMVQIGDRIVRLDLSTETNNYPGQTQLLVRKGGNKESISSKYRPLVTQGFSIGETAETLWQDEFFVNYLGQIQYGLYPWMSLGTIVPANAVSATNAQMKFRFYQSSGASLAFGLNYTRIPETGESTVNTTFFWDSMSNSNLIAHNYITVAVVSFKNAQDAVALKAVGTSSLQTGYEFILSNWNRILVGPNYNFENKKVGGYISFIKIWDRFHLQASINTTNIESMKISAKDGYYPFVDIYWRY